MTSGADTPGGRTTDWSAPTPNRTTITLQRGPRVPYFDRPKPPHDWRWVVGGIGRTLIVTGLMMFGFVGYQLWGTGIQTAQAQNELESEFQRQLAATTTVVTTAPSTDDPGAVTTTTTVPTAPVRTISNGDPVAVLSIPKIGLNDVYIVEGVRFGDLKKGPGHFKETPMPGQLGNAAIAGHRTTYGHPFLELDQLAPGDRIEVETVDGTFVYAVTFSEVVKPAEYGKVIPTKDFDKATLVLATCHPAYTARERLIVHAEIVVEESDQLMRPSSFQEADPGSGIPGDSIPEETSPDGSAPVDTIAPSTDTVVDSVPDTVPTTAPTQQADPPEQSDDAFSQTWFSDTAAIPHVLGWGLVLTLVALGAYQVGKKARRLYVCFLVGALPFVLVLYFFFQNVNRFLPPGL